MVRSMTAYGRSLRQSNLGKWLVEVSSVNKKSLDSTVLLPKELFQFEVDIRRWISKHFKRGQITVKVSFIPSEEMCFLKKRREQIKELKHAMEEVCDDLGFQKADIRFPFVYQEVKSLPVVCFDVLDLAKEELKEVVLDAFAVCEQMKKKEGNALSSALLEHLSLLSSYLAVVEDKAGGAEKRLRQKILDKLQEFHEVSAIDQDRVLREVFFYTEKADITEEITRMKSHVHQFQGVLTSGELSIGRTMDFLLQEMGREVNTIGSKSDQLELSYAALKMKGEIEKLKEQVQNIE